MMASFEVFTCDKCGGRVYVRYGDDKGWCRSCRTAYDIVEIDR